MSSEESYRVSWGITGGGQGVTSGSTVVKGSDAVIEQRAKIRARAGFGATVKTKVTKI